MDLSYLNSLVYSCLSEKEPKLAEKFKREINADFLPAGSPTDLSEMVEQYLANMKNKRKLENSDVKMITGSAKKIKKEESISEDSVEEEESKPAGKTTKKRRKKKSKQSDGKPEKNVDKKEPMKHAQPPGKVFIHNVAETTGYDAFKSKVEKFGTAKDFYNPGRGFAFLTFSSLAEAEACIAAMDNTEVVGQKIQMNIAKPKGEKGNMSGKGRQQAAEGCKLFVHGVTQETPNADLQAAFEKYGTVIDAYNPGKGFAYVTFSNATEAKAAREGMEGGKVGGNVVNVSLAKPKGGDGSDVASSKNKEGEGCKIFVANLNEDTSNDVLRSAFGEHGKVKDAFNTGRGFGFVTYSSPEEAKKAVAAMGGTDVGGRTIKCNISNVPKEQGGKGGRKRSRKSGKKNVKKED